MVLPEVRRRPSFQIGTRGPFNLLPYRISLAERQKHMYVIGTTGAGKSKLLEGLMVEDITAGRAVGLIDPQTDLATHTLRHLASLGYFDAEAALDNLIYFEPTRSDYALPFNILKSSHLQSHEIADTIIDIFKRLWPEELAAAPRFTNVVESAIIVLVDNGLSLAEMPRLLLDKDYRDGLLPQVRNPVAVQFFTERMDKWGREMVANLESVNNKVTHLLMAPYLRRILGATDNRLDFRRLLDEGKTLLVDLGRCSPEIRQLLGGLIVAGIEHAATSRTEIEQRRPFYLFVDEFQKFCGGSGGAKTFSEILSECRKVGLYLHLANQTLGQLSERIVSALGNVAIKVACNIDRDDGEIMARKLFSVNPDAIKRLQQTEVQHPIYSPLPEQWEKWVNSLQQLPDRWAWVKRRSKVPVLIKTKTIAPYTVTHDQTEELKTRLAKHHGVAVAHLDEEQGRAPAPRRTIMDWEPAAVTPAASAVAMIYQAG